MVRFSVKLGLLGVVALVLSGCFSDSGSHWHHGFASAANDPFAGKGSPYYKGKYIPFGGGQYTVGNPYQVAGRWYTPREQPGYDKSGTASWYGEAFNRRRTSNGEWFDMNTLTAAHATLPLPSYVMVTNLENNRKIIVRVNDRGPFVGTRVIDLSKKAADMLAYRSQGTAHVRVQLLSAAPQDDSMSHMVAMNQAMSQGASMRQLVAMANDPSVRSSSNTMVADADMPPLPRQPMPAQQPVAMAAIPVPPAQDDGLDDSDVQQADYAPAPAPQPTQAYIVRVAVFHNLKNASSVYQQLAGFGPTRIVRAVGVNGPLYRVEMGPLDNRADADAAMTTAQSEGFEDAKMVVSDPLQISMN